MPKKGRTYAQKKRRVYAKEAETMRRNILERAYVNAMIRLDQMRKSLVIVATHFEVTHRDSMKRVGATIRRARGW